VADDELQLGEVVEHTTEDQSQHLDAGVVVPADARTIQECVQSVLWSGASALAPITQPLPPGLVVIPVRDRPASKVVVAWKVSVPNAAVRSFIDTAMQTFKQHRRG